MTIQDERDLRQEWETPTAANTAHCEHPCPFFDVVNAEFDFQIDLCATEANSKCVNFIGLEGSGSAVMIDALYEGTPWVFGDVLRGWLNPGFSRAWPWMKKAYTETQKGPPSVIVVMARISPSAYWWRNWAMKASEIRLLTNGSRPDMPSRIQFVPPPGVKASTNAQENCLIIFRPNPHNIFSPNIWTWDWTKEITEDA